MTCDDYLEHLWNDQSLHELLQEQYWAGGVDTYAIWLFMQDQAARDNITLLDRDNWDYDRALYNCYVNDDDLGLS